MSEEPNIPAEELDERLRTISGLLEDTAEYYRASGQRVEITDPVARLYIRALWSYPPEVISHAFNAHLQDTEAGQFFPKIADLKRHLSGTRTDRGTLAWSKVIGAIRRRGPWPSVGFDDPVIHTVIDEMGGWPAVCAWTNDELPFRERDFLRRYSAWMRVPDPPHPPYLKGITQSQNEKGGGGRPGMFYIGDERRAREIARGRRGRHRQRIGTDSKNNAEGEASAEDGRSAGEDARAEKGGKDAATPKEGGERGAEIVLKQ